MRPPGRLLAETSPSEWQGSVASQLASADMSKKQAADTMREGMLTVRSTNHERSVHRDSVHSSFSQKIANTKEMAQMLSTKIHSVSKSIEQSEWSLKRLQDVLKALAEPLDLCRRRLQLRQQLPRRERVCDSFQEALQKEERDLLAAKSAYTQAINDTQRLIRELQKRKEELEADLRDKKHAQHLDTMCVDRKAREKFSFTLDKSYSRKGTGSPKGLPELSSTPRSDYMESSAGHEQERQRQIATLGNLEQASKTQELARHRWSETGVLIESTNKALQNAHKSTQAELAAKVEHTEVLREELVKQGSHTSKKIAELQNTLGTTTEKLEAIDVPLTANRNREGIRSHRSAREAHLDQVGEALHGQQQALQTKKWQLQSQSMSMQTTLDELTRTYKLLQEDIADKTKALQIERACASVKNDAHGNFSFGFARVGTGQKHLADTASSRGRQSTPVSVALSARSPTS